MNMDTDQPYVKTIALFFLLILLIASNLGYASTNENKTEGTTEKNLEVAVNIATDDNLISKTTANIISTANDKIIQQIKKNLSILRYKAYALEDINHLRLFYNSIPEETKNTLINFGYFTPDVSVSLKQTSNTWLIRINIRLNQATTVNQIHISTTPNIQYLNDRLREQIPLKEGSILIQNDYLSSKSQLLSVVNEAGYLDATLDTSKVLVNKDKHTAEVNFHITLGKRYHYGKISIIQKKYLFDVNFLKKFIPLKEGQTYDAGQINKTQKQLDESAYFSSVTVIPNLKKRDAHTGEVPIRIEVIARESQAYSIGLGYGTFTGPRMTLGATYPHLSADGHSASMQLQVSKINTSFLAQYLIPGNDPVHTYWSLNAQQSLYDLIPYQALETLIGINYIDNITKSISVNLGLHEYIIRYTTSLSSDAASANYLVPSINVSYSLRKPDGFFDNGLMFSDLVQAAPSINHISDESFIRNLATLRIAVPIYRQWTRFISSYNFGALSTDDITTIAPEFRFYAGGIGTLLGYAYLSQGPELDGNLTGGRYLLTASAGIEQRIYGNFSTVLYYNVGNAFNQFNEVNPLHAAGVGLSWRSPLGPVVGYLTRTLNADDEHWRFDFSIGTYF
ncbi:BamA/TamA family outer membrane protein [Thiotrichales bacterium 19S3-7]|nr:BamA/TamA family outer membrane protein [Thiotrichales bacterium 19S3-7]MCF6802892.1 BamA/TamA family outer membrane protein [Thiotrichales bacterium 19S3-11]